MFVTKKFQGDFKGIFKIFLRYFKKFAYKPIECYPDEKEFNLSDTDKRTLDILPTISMGSVKMENKPSNNNMTLTETFTKYFSLELAKTTTQKNKVYTIRYNVYCKEFAYESIDCYPDGKESDEYDKYSLHCLITHRSTKIPAACVRLIPAFNNGSNVQLPFEKYCAESLDMNFINQLNLDRKTQCEISRLAVDCMFRRRSREALTRFGDINLLFKKEEQRAFPMIAIAGFFAATVLTELSGKTNMFAMMEPPLPRLLKRSGIVFKKAGREINYHGIRAPYFLTTQSILDNMQPELLELYHWIHKQCG